MAEPDGIAASRFWRFLRIAGLGIALVFLVGVAAGFLASWNERHDGFSARAAIILAVITLAAIGAALLIVREIKAPSGEEPLTKRERMNRNILIGCGLLGLVIGITVTVASGGKVLEGAGVFSNDPLPPAVAAVLILVLGVLLPIISRQWHRVIDEQEADAYKTGALYGLYVYMVGAPLWWLAWRGGFVPAPNGFIIYYAVVLTMGAVWFWKKYR